VDNIAAERGEMAITTLLQMSKRGSYDEDFSKEVREGLSSILEKTMNYSIDEYGRVVRKFPLLEEKGDIIASKLGEFRFSDSLKAYNDAFDVYGSSPKASLGLLRVAIENIIHDILKSLGSSTTNNQKENFKRLKELELIRELDSQECANCHHRKRDHEFNHAYTLYGLLSHYGSHKKQVTDDIADFLFTSTATLIWLLVIRYEKRIKS
jgi:hypothetical protein